MKPKNLLRPIGALFLGFAWVSLSACGTDSLESKRLDLRKAMDVAGLDVTGISIDQDTGERYVLDSVRGIYRMEGDKLVLHSHIANISGTEVPDSGFHDFAALGNDQFALIARNDGFLYDRNSGAFNRHFCYVPDWDPGWEPNPEPEPEPGDPIRPITPTPIISSEPYTQLALNLAYHQPTETLIAQPQTFSANDGRLLGAHVGTFDRNDGAEQVWYRMPDDDMSAGGLAVQADGRVLLGWQTQLLRFDAQAGTLDVLRDLAGVVNRIDGLALDSRSGRLLILDNDADELVEIDVSKLLP